MPDLNKLNASLRAKVRAHRTPREQFDRALDELKRRDPMWWTIWTEVPEDAEYQTFTKRIRERLKALTV